MTPTQTSDVPAITSFSGQYDFLSNFYYAPISYDLILFPTNEHAFQAAKSEDYVEQLHIAGLATPGAAKAAGRRVQLRSDWNTARIDVMRELIRLKFAHPNDELAQRLMMTAPAELIEGNNWGDRFWGVDGTGENWLGRLLMERRDELIAEATVLLDDLKV